MKIVFPCIKGGWLLTLFISCLIFELPLYLNLLLCLLALCFYQNIVALIIPNTIKMGPLDHHCFLSSSKAHVNYMNMQLQDKPCEETAIRNFRKLLSLYPKMTYKIKEIAGDYYYEKMSIDETMEKAFLKA